MRRARRLARALGVSAIVACSGAVLGACGGSSSSLGHRACVDVAVSLRQFASAAHAPDASARRAEALTGLRRALPLAALAAGSDGQWQALEATLSESSRVPESELVTALGAECAAALAPGG